MGRGHHHRRACSLVATRDVDGLPCLLTACGPSDTEAAADTAADLRDAKQQARAEIHQAQALALMAASGHK